MSFPLRILHVVVCMNRGGLETLLMNIYRNIDRTKVQFDFLTSKEGVFEKEILEMGGKVYRIPYITEVGHFKYIRILENFFVKHREYNIVHSHLNKMSGIVLRSAKKADIPVRIAHSHSTASSGGVLARVYKWYVGQYILLNATHLQACSNDAAKWLFSKKIDETSILKNGIICTDFEFSNVIRKRMRKELEISSDCFVVGHVGRFYDQKNHRHLIKMFAELTKHKPNAVLVLAGDGPLRSEIEKKVEHLNILNKVKFLGVRNDINRLLQVFDVFVFPSHFEGLGIVLIEAQAIGLPCLISDVLPKESDMEIGLIEYLPLNNINLWVDKIKGMYKFTIKNNKSFLDAIRKKGYDIKHSASWIESFYLNVLR